MRSKWTKLISVVCLVAMLVGMLPVVASADVVTHTLDCAKEFTETSGKTLNNQTVTYGSYFKVSYGSSGAVKSSAKTFDDKYEGTFYIDFGGTCKADNSRYMEFTTQAVTELKVWWTNGEPVLWKDKVESGKITGTTATGTSGSITTFSNLAADTTYWLMYPTTKGYTYKVVATEADTTPSIKLDKETATVEVDSSIDLTATVSNAEGATVTWSSSADNKATVTGSGDNNVTGTVTGIAATETDSPVTVTAKITVGGTDYSATCKVTVEPAAGHEHTYPDDWTVTKAATCTETGTREKQCTHVEDEVQCTSKLTETIDALRHNTVENGKTVGAKAATCTEDGSTGKVICGRMNGETECQEELQAAEDINRKGHTFDGVGKKCADCDVVCPETVTIDLTTALTAEEKGYVTLSTNPETTENTTYAATINGESFPNGLRLKLNSSGKVDFKAPDVGTLTIYVCSKNSSGTASSVSVNGTNTDIVAGAEDVNGGLITVSTNKGQTIQLRRGDKESALFKLVWSAPKANNVERVTIAGPNGQTAQVAEVRGEDLDPMTYTATVVPSGAEYDDIKWTITPPEGAVMGDGKGVTIRGNREGTAKAETALVTVHADATVGNYTITAQAYKGTGEAAVAVGTAGTDTLTVKKPILKSWAFDPADDVVLQVGKPGKTIQVKSTWVEPAEGNFAIRPADKADEAVFSVDKENVITVDSGTDTADGAATVTALHASTTPVVITAKSVRDGSAETTLKVTVNKGDVDLKIAARNEGVNAAGNFILFKVTGLPAGVDPVSAVTVSPSEGVTVGAVTSSDLTDGATSADGWNVKVTLPANTSATEDKAYTVKAAFDGNDDWNAAADDASTTVYVRKVGTKVIRITNQSNHGDKASLKVGDKLELSVDAVVMKDGAEQTGETISFKWYKDTTEITQGITNGPCAETGHVGHTQSTLVIDHVTTADAGTYKVVVSAEGAAAEREPSLVVEVAKNAGVTPTATFEAADLTLTGVKNGWQYSLDQGTTWVTMENVQNGVYTIQRPTDEEVVKAVNGIEVKDPGDDDTEAATQHITLTRATQPVLGGEDTRLVVLNYKDEYKTLYQIKGDIYTDWTDTQIVERENADHTVVGIIAGLRNGIEYSVKVKYQGLILGSLLEGKGTPVKRAGDATELYNAIAKATTAKEGVKTSADGKDVLKTQLWVTEKAMQDFEKAIADAKAVADNAQADQETLDGATRVLNAAIADWKPAQGLKEPVEPGTVDKTELDAAIEAAQAIDVDAVKVSKDGKDVARSEKWVTQAVKDALVKALADAEAVSADENASQEDVDKAQEALDAAVAAWKPANGTKATSGGNTGSSSGSSTAGGKTETETKPNGDKVTTVTQPNGTVTETTQTADGTKTVVTTKPDGTVTATVTQPDGVKADMVTNINGETTAEVTVPSKVDRTTVTLPANDVKPGTVAVIVKEDGTEEIVRMSAAGEDGLTVTLTESAKLKLIDNSKSFVDMPGHWAEDEVNFVAAREIFNGTSETHFTPDTATTRGMVATALFRLDGERKAGKAAQFADVGDTWYTEAVAWAAEKNVVNGYDETTFAPDDNVTREQLVVMVYRYAKLIGLDVSVKGDLSAFSDSASVSEYATQAMTWAVEQGIVNGRGAGVLAPAGNATRAEVAAILGRFLTVANG